MHYPNKNKLMRKYLLITFIASVILMACNESDQQIEVATGKVVEMEVVKMSSDTLKIQPMKVSNLSTEELKDDSVFKDGSKPISWDSARVTDVKGLKLFIKQLQQWIIANDQEKLASVVKYPLNRYMKTKENVLENFDAVFTKQVKLSLTTINFNQLFRNAKGVMTDGGRVWLNQQGKDFMIIAINYTSSRRSK